MVRDSVTLCDSSHDVTRPNPEGLTRDRLGVNASAYAALPAVTQPDGIEFSAPDKAPQSFKFETLPTLGAVVMYHGQRYVMVGSGDLALKSGETIPATLWETHCARCAQPFVAKVIAGGGGTRRCEICRTLERGRV